MRNIAREPRTYELLTILSPEVPEEEIPGAIERISSHVTGAGGSLEETLRDSPWGRRRLAYPIRHSGRDLRDGFYTLFRVSLAPDRIEEMERELKLNTQVMRYLVTTYAPKPLDPRALEDAEVAAEDAAAAAYAEAQAEAARLTTANAAAEAAEAGAASAAAATEPPADAAASDQPAETETAATEAPADAAAETETASTAEPAAAEPAAAEAPAAEEADTTEPATVAPDAAAETPAESADATSPETREES